MQRGTSFFSPLQARDFWADSWSVRGGFSPAAISGLLIWLHADLGVAQSGGNLTAWTDQQGQRVSGINGTPAVNSSGFNARQSIEIDSTNDAVLFTGAAANWTTSNAWTVIAAANMQFFADTSFDAFFHKGADTNNRVLLDADQARITIGGSNTNVDTAASGVASFKGEGVHVMRASGTSFDGWFDGTAYSENTDTLGGGAWDWDEDPITLFNDSALTNGLIGHLRIWLLYDRAISNAEINQVVHKYVEPETGLTTWSDI